MLQIKNVEKKFGSLTAVDNLSLTLNQGEILGLLGANGAGKTTTFRMIMDIIQPTSGEITYNNKHVSLDDVKIIGYLCEERAMLPKYTVEKQLKFFAELKGMKPKDAETQMDYWLEYFEMTDKKKKMIKELSKGNQQKIQFISAVIHKPKLIILDEPFSGLDPFNVSLFKKAILELRDNGCAVIFSSHRLDHVEYFCENIIVLVDGGVALSGRISDLREESSQKKVNIKSSIPSQELSSLDFVSKVEENGDFRNVFVNSKDDFEKLFEVIKKYSCTHFSVELPSLEEVFIEKVGKSYES